MRTTSLILAFCTTATVGAQVAISYTALTPITATTWTGATPTTVTSPAGPMAGNFVIASGPVMQLASYEHRTLNFPGMIQSSFEQHATNTVSGSITLLSLCEVLVEVQTPIPNDVEVELSYSNLSTPGVVTPTLQIDLDDDGTVDFTNGAGIAPGTRIPRTIGAQPLRIRLVFEAANGQLGDAAARLTVNVRPTNAIQVTTAAIGCGFGGVPNASIDVAPSFLGNGVFASVSPDVTVVVFGLSLQPLLLPSIGSSPCLLVPSVDVVLVPPPAALPFQLALPASVRPATLWVQGVKLALGQLLLTDARRVDAL